MTKKLEFQKQRAIFHNKGRQHEHKNSYVMDLSTTFRNYFNLKKIIHDKVKKEKAKVVTKLSAVFLGINPSLKMSFDLPLSQHFCDYHY